MGSNKSIPAMYSEGMEKPEPSTLRLYGTDFKGVKGMTIGQEVTLEIKAKVVSVSADEYRMGGKETTCARLDVTSVKGEEKE